MSWIALEGGGMIWYELAVGMKELKFRTHRQYDEKAKQMFNFSISQNQVVSGSALGEINSLKRLH